ncbi:unnamed protein product [Adineta ricciae]|uniref:Uncharacterized protein n=1 Tax=Adineta ricciae TaxID=249248 RepID=A0A814Z3Y3_ADIRI|nr:unnamed protein product [Adineta ricciae]
MANIGNPAPHTVNGYAENGKCRRNVVLLKSIFQSTAKEVKIHDSLMSATTAVRGAGLVNALQALTGTTMFSPTHYADVDIEPIQFELQGGQSREITSISGPKTSRFCSTSCLFGFYFCHKSDEWRNRSLSYAGVVGDYGNARIIVRNSSSVIITGIKNKNGNYITNAQISTVNRASRAKIIVVLAWSTRLLYVNVIPAEDNVQFDPEIGTRKNVPLVLSTSGFDIDILSCFALFSSHNQPRNVPDSDVQNYSSLLEIPWYGRVERPNSNDSSQMETHTLGSGHHRIQFAALKHFGNLSKFNDYEIYCTPPFNFVS